MKKLSPTRNAWNSIIYTCGGEAEFLSLFHTNQKINTNAFSSRVKIHSSLSGVLVVYWSNTVCPLCFDYNTNTLHIYNANKNQSSSQLFARLSSRRFASQSRTVINKTQYLWVKRGFYSIISKIYSWEFHTPRQGGKKCSNIRHSPTKVAIEKLI